MTAPVINPPFVVFDTKLGDRALKAADIDSLVHEVADALTAAGTNLATALALTAHVNHITTAALSTGAVLPTMTINQQVIVYNDGANPIKIYAPNSATIDGVAGATGVTLTNAKRCMYTMYASGKIISAQLGAPSA